MSFGWSIGNIAECITLLIKIGDALQDPGGSAAEYQSAVDFLKGVETTVLGVETSFRTTRIYVFRPLCRNMQQI
jgi:hypothetical protein